MRNIGPEWRNLAEGFDAQEALGASFRAKRGTQLVHEQHREA